MLLDFEVQRSTRRCAATDCALEPGSECFAVLEVQGADVIRRDYCRQAWAGPPDGALGWWKWRVPEPTAKKIKLAPNDVLLQLFDCLADDPMQQDVRYVLTLLLVRRRVLRFEAPGELPNEKAAPFVEGSEHETMHVYCPKRDTTYHVPVVSPSVERIDVIQQQLSDLLVAGAN